MRNILARVGEQDLWALVRGFSLEYSVTKIHAVRKAPGQTAADSPMLVFFECRDDSSCSALMALLNGQHFPGICKYPLMAEIATPRMERASVSKTNPPVRTVGPRPGPVQPLQPQQPLQPPWHGLPIPPPPPPGVQRVVRPPRPPARPARPVRPVPSSIATPSTSHPLPDACQPKADVGGDGGMPLRLTFIFVLFLFRICTVFISKCLDKKEVD